MIKIKRNVKRGERRKLGIKRNSKARREHGLRNFATKSKPLRKLPPVVKPFRSRPPSSVKIFRSYGIGCEIPHLLHSCENPILYKMLSRCGNDLQASKWAVKMFFFFPLGGKMISKIRNDLQAIKMTCKMKRGLQKHFAKPREVAKMPMLFSLRLTTMHLKRRALSLGSHT